MVLVNLAFAAYYKSAEGYDTDLMIESIIFTLDNIKVTSNFTAFNTEFYGVLDLSNSHFKKVNFKATSFNKLVLFNDVRLKNKLNLANTIFKDEIDFLNAKIIVKNRETARIIKYSFEKKDSIIEANKYYALEMKEREKELADKSNKDYNWSEMVIFKIHKITSNHSQSWTLVLLWIINLGFFASFVEFFSSKNYINLTPWNITITLVLIVYLMLILMIVKKNIMLCIKTIPFVLYIGYSLITYDIFLNDFAKILNPFSIMDGKDNINIFQLVCKVGISYLIYQLIISIRQNTRRK